MRKVMFKWSALASGVLLAVTGVAATSVASVTSVSGGNPATAAYAVDQQANFSVLDGNQAIDKDGALTSWSFYAQGSAGGPVMLKIYRLSGGVYSVVGMSTAVNPVADSVNTQALSTPILVKAGDFVGFQTTSLGVIPYDKGAVEYAGGDLTHVALFTNVGSNATTGNTETFTGSGDRTYSINVSGTTIELSATPAGEYVPVGTTHSLVAYIGSAVAGVTVHFDIAGPNAGQSGTAVTDATGHATFTYTGSMTPGTDTITTWVDQDMSGGMNAGDPSVTSYKYWFAQYTSFGGNAGQVVRGNALTWAFDGFAGYVPGAPGTGAFGSVTVNYRALGKSCTFTPGATGTFEIGSNPTMFPNVVNNVASLRGWTSSCGGTYLIQVLVPSSNTATQIDWSRGAVFVWKTTGDPYNVNGNLAAPINGWAALVTGMTHVVSP